MATPTKFHLYSKLIARMLITIALQALLLSFLWGLLENSPLHLPPLNFGYCFIIIIIVQLLFRDPNVAMAAFHLSNISRDVGYFAFREEEKDRATLELAKRWGLFRDQKADDQDKLDQ